MRKFFSLMLLLATVSAFTACSDDDDDPAPYYKDLSLNAGESYVLEDVSNWESAEPLIASVSNGIVSAIRVGQTTISNGKSSFDVTVNPTCNLYEEPFLQWGASISTVTEYMRAKKYTMHSSSSELITYNGKNKETLIEYFFKEEKLYGVAVAVKFTSATSEEVALYLKERYIPMQSDNEYIYLMSIDKKTVVVLSVESGYYLIMYLDKSLSNTSTLSKSIGAKLNFTLPIE